MASDQMGNLLNMFVQLKQLDVARQDAATRLLATQQQGNVDASNVMQGFVTALSHTNKANRQPIVDAFAKSTGADPDLLSKIASTIQDSPELLRQQAANDAVQSGAFTAPQIAAQSLTGQSLGQSSEDKMFSDFVNSQGSSLGANGPALYHGHLSKFLTGLDEGDAAQSAAKASLPQSTLQRMATNAGGTTLNAQAAAELPIQLMGAQAALQNAGTAQSGMQNSFILGLGGLQQQANALGVDNMVKLLTARSGATSQQAQAVKEVADYTAQLQHPMTPGAAAMIQAALENARQRAGLAPGSVAPQSLLGGIGFGLSGGGGSK